MGFRGKKQGSKAIALLLNLLECFVLLLVNGQIFQTVFNQFLSITQFKFKINVANTFNAGI